MAKSNKLALGVVLVESAHQVAKALQDYKDSDTLHDAQDRVRGAAKSARKESGRAAKKARKAGAQKADTARSGGLKVARKAASAAASHLPSTPAARRRAASSKHHKQGLLGLIVLFVAAAAAAVKIRRTGRKDEAVVHVSDDFSRNGDSAAKTDAPSPPHSTPVL